MHTSSLPVGYPSLPLHAHRAPSRPCRPPQRFTYWLAGIYASIGLVGFTIAAPLVALLLFVSPGSLWQLLVSAPHWAYRIVQSRNPGLFDDMFLTELHRLDAGYAEGLKEKLARGAGASSGRRSDAAGHRGGVISRARGRWADWWHFGACMPRCVAGQRRGRRGDER
jgi:hypothetical protein